MSAWHQLAGGRGLDSIDLYKPQFEQVFTHEHILTNSQKSSEVSIPRVNTEIKEDTLTRKDSFTSPFSTVPMFRKQTFSPVIKKKKRLESVWDANTRFVLVTPKYSQDILHTNLSTKLVHSLEL